MDPRKILIIEFLKKRKNDEFSSYQLLELINNKFKDQSDISFLASLFNKKQDDYYSYYDLKKIDNISINLYKDKDNSYNKLFLFVCFAVTFFLVIPNRFIIVSIITLTILLILNIIQMKKNFIVHVLSLAFTIYSVLYIFKDYILNYFNIVPLDKSLDPIILILTVFIINLLFIFERNISYFLIILCLFLSFIVSGYFKNNIIISILFILIFSFFLFKKKLLTKNNTTNNYFKNFNSKKFKFISLLNILNIFPISYLFIDGPVNISNEYFYFIAEPNDGRCFNIHSLQPIAFRDGKVFINSDFILKENEINNIKKYIRFKNEQKDNIKKKIDILKNRYGEKYIEKILDLSNYPDLKVLKSDISMYGIKIQKNKMINLNKYTNINENDKNNIINIIYLKFIYSLEDEYIYNKIDQIKKVKFYNDRSPKNYFYYKCEQ